MRKFQCLKPQRQAELASQFSWLAAVHEDQTLPLGVRTLNLSVFDHWLSEREADTLISASSKEDLVHHDLRLKSFYSLMIAETEVLSFVWRGLRKSRLRFRSFTSPAAALNYLEPSGSGLDYAPHIQLVLPQFSAAYYQGWDNTSHIYFAQPMEAEAISGWAMQAGLHVLP